MPHYRWNLGSDLQVPLFYKDSGVGYIVSNWFFGWDVTTVQVYLKGREDIVTSSAHAYTAGVLPIERNYRQFGSEYYTVENFYVTSGVSDVLRHLFFQLPGSTLYAYLEGYNPNDVKSSKSAFTVGYVPHVPSHMILGDEQERYTTPIFYTTSGVSGPAQNWYFSNTTNYIHAYLASVSYTALVARLLFDIPTGNEKHGYVEAFLRGQADITSVQDAYMNSGTNVQKSAIAAYLFCQMDTQADTPAYLVGYSTASSTTPAFLHGSADDQSNQPAFLKGHIPVSGSRKAYLRGSVNDQSSTLAYLAGIVYASSSIHAYTSSGTNTSSSHPAYMWCDYSRSSAHAFMIGFTETAKPAYLNGGGTFPFTDDFTGSDGSVWNNLKWEISEE